jgi:hypothetical protein
MARVAGKISLYPLALLQRWKVLIVAKPALFRSKQVFWDVAPYSWAIRDVVKKRTAFIFRVITLRMNAVGFFETSGTKYQAILRYKP